MTGDGPPEEPRGGAMEDAAGEPEQALAKADPRLRQELERPAPGPHRLRVVMVLVGLGGDAGGRAFGAAEGGPAGEGREDDDAPRPGDYPDRVAWRRALLEHRQGRVDADLGSARHALEELGLEVRGGRTGAVVVVDGPAVRIRRALALSCVRKATLDREVRPRPPR